MAIELSSNAIEVLQTIGKEFPRAVVFNALDHIGASTQKAIVEKIKSYGKAERFQKVFDSGNLRLKRIMGDRYGEMVNMPRNILYSKADGASSDKVVIGWMNTASFTRDIWRGGQKIGSQKVQSIAPYRQGNYTYNIEDMGEKMEHGDAIPTSARQRAMMRLSGLGSPSILSRQPFPVIAPIFAEQQLRIAEIVNQTAKDYLSGVKMADRLNLIYKGRK